MQMSHFSTDLQHSLTNFHKPTTMDPTRFHQPGSLDRTEADDRLSATTNNTPVSPYEKETMFEKPLTPSDVGKLNRLVIPKQYAEKYFPLSGGGGDTSGGLLGFEEESGKCWRFRYSYWNSSQSYVLTKGWSRYVKDKGLDAGDVVFFERHRSDPDRLFIGWRRRGAPPPPQLPPAFCYNAPGGVIGIPHYQGERRRHHAGGVMEPTTTTAARNGNNNPTRLVRLFGVNFECQSDPDSPSQTTSSHSFSDPIQSQQQHQHQQQQEAFRNYFNYMGHHPQQHMVMDMDGDNHMGNHLG